MKLQYCSDLHLEFPENKAFLKNNPLIPTGEILILAGDIVPFAVMHKHKDFFDLLADNFEQVYWIPGNHEYYHSDIADRTGKVNEKIRPNISLVNNYSVIHHDVKLIFSTLWTRLSLTNQWIIQQRLSDFHVIHDHGKPFHPAEYNRLHSECLEFLQAEITGEKTVVISHHVPTFLNYPEKYKGDALNEAFAVELFDFIEKSAVDFWIFGHHHQNLSDFMICKTKMCTNQLGYVKYQENKGFSVNKTIEI
ncbi:MAG: metallophosphoesterase [Bacteroidia bacterium]|nr:metallophosphoesterase [Bacteroidia bacterium]